MTLDLAIVLNILTTLHRLNPKNIEALDNLTIKSNLLTNID